MYLKEVRSAADMNCIPKAGIIRQDMDRLASKVLHSAVRMIDLFRQRQTPHVHYLRSSEEVHKNLVRGLYSSVTSNLCRLKIELYRVQEWRNPNLYMKVNLGMREKFTNPGQKVQRRKFSVD